MPDDRPSQKTTWSLTQGALDQFLLRLDLDRERAGEKYEQIRSGLVRFFEWRGCPSSDVHADETINRVARKLELGEEIQDVTTYVYGVARMVVLEVKKRAAREASAYDKLVQSPPDQLQDLQDQVECLQECLEALPVENRQFILEYYQGETRGKINNRKKLAERLSVSLTALRIRAYRVRAKLEGCLERCLAGEPNVKKRGRESE